MIFKNIMDFVGIVCFKATIIAIIYMIIK